MFASTRKCDLYWARRERVNRITLVGVIKILIDPRPGVYLVVTALAVESTRLNVYFV